MPAALTRTLALLLFAGCLSHTQPAPQQSVPVFNSDVRLVLLSFNVVRGAYFAPDVRKDDVTLLQDGKPREFTLFEGPASDSRPPLELILLFETTTLPPPGSKTTVKFTHWDRDATFRFTTSWSDAESRAILAKAGADVRASVYRYDHDRMQNLCRSAKDPQTLTRAIHRLLEPMPEAESVALAVPRDRMTLADLIARRGSGRPDPNRQAWPLSWTYEAMIAALDDSTTAAGAATRALIVFSEMDGPTTTKPQDAADKANALGVPVYPVVLDFDEYVRHPFSQGGAGGPGSTPLERPKWAPAYDPNAPRQSMAAIRDWSTGDTIGMARFGSVGPLTGAEALYPSELNAGVFGNILSVIRDKNLSQYIVGFAPQPSARQKKHSLEIRLKSKSLGELKGGRRSAEY